MSTRLLPSLVRLAPVVLLCLWVAGCDWFGGAEETVIRGQTMGTSFTVRVVGLPDGVTAETLEARILARLAAVNQAMSTWDPSSEISRFNATAALDWFPVSDDFHTVIKAAQAISAATEGTFDVTVAPLVRLWGFGNAQPRTDPPTQAEIAALRDWIGFEKLEVDADRPRIRKTHPRLTLDLSAIAKGYGVDAVAELIEQDGIENYMVEIGGELRVRGQSAEGTLWRIGIERPDATGRSVLRVVPLARGAMATSGDYRNFFIKDGQRYSHLLDPSAGRPILHRLASVSVVMDQTMWADGYATALMVMGDRLGVSFAEGHDLAALFLIRAEDGNGLEVRTTKAFDRLIEAGAAPDAASD